MSRTFSTKSFIWPLVHTWMGLSPMPVHHSQAASALILLQLQSGKLQTPLIGCRTAVATLLSQINTKVMSSGYNGEQCKFSVPWQKPLIGQSTLLIAPRSIPTTSSLKITSMCETRVRRYDNQHQLTLQRICPRLVVVTAQLGKSKVQTFENLKTQTPTLDMSRHVVFFCKDMGKF